MKESLAGKDWTPLPPYKKRSYVDPQRDCKTPQRVDIHAISPAAFHFDMKDRKNELFTTSLYEIDRLLYDNSEAAEGAELEDDVDWQAALQKVLPEEYWNFR